MLLEAEINNWIQRENIRCLALRLRIASLSPQMAVARFGQTVAFWEAFSKYSLETIIELASTSVSLVSANVDLSALAVAERCTTEDLEQFLAVRPLGQLINC